MNHQVPSLKAIMNSIVPITRFNRGEASKIFDEVNQTGVKVVLKNNAPVGVLVDPEQYEAMVEMLEDFVLWFEAEKRSRKSDRQNTISQDQVMKKLGISPADLDGIDVDIDE